MKKIKVKVGDIFLMSFRDQFAVCKVLWISKRTKKVFSFIIKDNLIKLNDEGLNVILTSRNIKVKLFSGIVEVFYTNIEKLQTGEWEIIGNIDLDSEEQNDLLYHNIGGTLFKGDNEIRALSIEELQTIPKMLVAGYAAINDFLEIAFEN